MALSLLLSVVEPATSNAGEVTLISEAADRLKIVLQKFYRKLRQAFGLMHQIH